MGNLVAAHLIPRPKRACRLSPLFISLLRVVRCGQEGKVACEKSNAREVECQIERKAAAMARVLRGGTLIPAIFRRMAQEGVAQGSSPAAPAAGVGRLMHTVIHPLSLLDWVICCLHILHRLGLDKIDSERGKADGVRS